MPPIPTLLFALSILHAGYLTQLSFRQPSTRKITSSPESWPMYLAASPAATTTARLLITAISAYHALLSLALTRPDASLLHATCPQPAHLDAALFAWSPRTLAALVLLWGSSALRFAAYAALGADFTYRIARPEALVTSGLYGYVRHPSYTGLLGVLVAVHGLFFGQRGFVSCWVPGWGEDGWVAVGVTVVGFAVSMWLFMVRRVREEERMMEREFGGQWREYRARTKKFIPFVL